MITGVEQAERRSKRKRTSTAVAREGEDDYLDEEDGNNLGKRVPTSLRKQVGIKSTVPPPPHALQRVNSNPLAMAGLELKRDDSLGSIGSMGDLSGVPLARDDSFNRGPLVTLTLTLTLILTLTLMGFLLI